MCKLQVNSANVPLIDVYRALQQRQTMLRRERPGEVVAALSSSVKSVVWTVH